MKPLFVIMLFVAATSGINAQETVQLQTGLILEIMHRVCYIEPHATSSFSLDLHFPVLPTATLTFFYCL